MRPKNIIDALGGIDADMIADAERKIRKRNPWLKRAVIAACLCLVICAAVCAPMLLGELPDEMTDGSTGGNGSDVVIGTAEDSLPPEPPIFDDAVYSAEYIADLLKTNRLDAIPTNAYTEVYLPMDMPPRIALMPEDEYLSIYEYHSPAAALDESEFKAFIDAILPRAAGAVGEKAPKYDIEKSGFSSDYLTTHFKMGAYDLFAFQTQSQSRMSISSASGDRSVALYGEVIKADQRMSDEDILDSLVGVRDKLFKIFGTSFKDAKVIRSYNSYSEYGTARLAVYFYDEDAHPLNSVQGTPVSDHISISFDNYENYSGDIVSKDVLTVASVAYVENRGDAQNCYREIAKAKRISLDDAEVLLYNGYVFGGHSCPLCMEAQDKISFDGYSFVGLEYLFGYDYKSDEPILTEGIPFYAFYKEIGTSKNGNIIYAKTYVPAIEVSGYAEYFESQKSEHKN